MKRMLCGLLACLLLALPSCGRSGAGAGDADTGENPPAAITEEIGMQDTHEENTEEILTPEAYEMYSNLLQGESPVGPY